MRYFLPLFFFICLLFASCQNEQETIQPEEVLLSSVDTDSTTIKFEHVFNELPEFKNWEYSYFTDTNKTGTCKLEIVKMIIDEKVFYHIELKKHRNCKVTDSFVSPIETACTFRVDPTDDKIKIFDADTKTFIDLLSENGIQYLKKCLANKA